MFDFIDKITAYFFYTGSIILIVCTIVAIVLFNKLKDSIPQFKDTIEKYETLHEFSNLSPYQSTIIDEDIKNPTLEIKKGDKTFSLTTEHIEKDTDKYFKDFLNYEHKDKQHNKDNELDL